MPHLTSFLQLGVMAGFFSSIMVEEVSGEFFTPYSGYGIKKEAMALLAETTKSSLGACSLYCLSYKLCQFASYNTKTMECSVYETREFDKKRLVFVKDEDSVYLHRKSAAPGWVLAFRATNGTGLDVYDAWQNTSHRDDDRMSSASVPIGCLTVDKNLPCDDKIYRHSLLDNWTNTVLVAFAVFENDIRSHIAEFSTPAGTNKDTALKFENYYNSSFLDMSNKALQPHPFSVAGDPNLNRRFFMNRSYTNCTNDSGWMVVVGREISIPHCPWDTFASYPQFLYTTTTVAEKWQLRGVADVFAVFVKVNY